MLRDNRQKLFIRAPNSGKENLCNYQKFEFPCPQQFFDFVPLSRIFQVNSFIFWQKAPLVCYLWSDVFRGVLQDIWNQRPHLIVICGHSNGYSLEEQFLKWHDIVGDYQNFEVQWIVLPRPSPKISSESTSQIVVSSHIGGRIQAPAGLTVFEYGNGSTEQDIRDIARDIIETVNLNHYIKVGQ